MSIKKECLSIFERLTDKKHHVKLENLDSDIAKDLKLDSLTKLELIIALENRFKIIIDDSDFIKLKTVRETIHHVKKLVDSKKS